MTPWTIARQAPLSMGFSRQEYWNGLPFLSPGDLPDPGIKPASPESPALVGRLFTTESPGKPHNSLWLREAVSRKVHRKVLIKVAQDSCSTHLRNTHQNNTSFRAETYITKTINLEDQPETAHSYL